MSSDISVAHLVTKHLVPWDMELGHLKGPPRAKVLSLFCLSSGLNVF